MIISRRNVLPARLRSYVETQYEVLGLVESYTGETGGQVR